MIVESELVERARMGGSALERLLEAVWPEAYRLAFSVLRDRHLAEDAAQEACAAMACSLHALNDSSAFRTWSYRIIISRALDVGRRRRRTAPLDAAAQIREEMFDRSDALDLYDALGSLPLDQRAALLLHYYGGLNSIEIAAAIDVAPSTVRFRIMLGRRALRKALSEPARPVIPLENSNAR